jgi:hypothetical protein
MFKNIIEKANASKIVFILISILTASNVVASVASANIRNSAFSTLNVDFKNSRGHCVMFSNNKNHM